MAEMVQEDGYLSCDPEGEGVGACLDEFGV